MCKCYNKLSVDIFKPKADCRAYLLYAEEMFLQCVFVQGALPSQPLLSALPWPHALLRAHPSLAHLLDSGKGLLCSPAFFHSDGALDVAERQREGCMFALPHKI